MKSNDKLIAVAIGSLLVVGAFMVGILTNFPGGDRSSIQAQESTTPQPKPQPTKEDLDRWAIEYPDLPRMKVQVIEEPPSPKGASGEFEPSQPGDRVIKFRDGSQKVLPDDVEIEYTFLWGGSRRMGVKPKYLDPTYQLRRGEDTVTVDSTGKIRTHVTEDNPEAFQFMWRIDQ